MDDILDTLRRFGAVRDDRCDNAGLSGQKRCDDLNKCVHRDHVKEAIVERIEPETVPLSAIPPITPALQERLASRGITRLYMHQAEAINHAMSGKNVVLEAPTASGKTLSFAIPVLESLANARGGHALFIYPMKAIADNQRKQFHRLHAGLTDLRGAPVSSETYDGDTDPKLRKEIRNNLPSILMTNVEYLNQSFLANCRSWRRFLDNLRWVVIDEMHEYRGYFGTNTAMLLRRFVHHLTERPNRDDVPQFFMASATSANPLEHARNLTGLEFELVSSRDSLRPERRYIFVDPYIPDREFWQVLKHRAARLAHAFYVQGKTAILFCPTREFAESAHYFARRRFSKSGHNPKLLRVYKGGMTPRDRRTILEDLDSGAAKIVFSTNALELGIDISGLDAIAMVGFPDNVMSARQQLGRAGRDWRADGTVVYLARNNPLDRFYARNLGAFLVKPLDELVTDLGNETIAWLHGDCIWTETGRPDPQQGLDHLGEGVAARVRQIIQWGGNPPGFGIKAEDPHHRMNLRGSDGDIHHLEHEREAVGTVSEHQKFSEAFDRAILLHGGQSYRVKRTEERRDRNGSRVRKVVMLELEQKDHRVEAMPAKAVGILAQYRQKLIGSGATVFLCDARIAEHLEEVDEYKNKDDRKVASWTVKPEEQHYRSEGRGVGWKIDLSLIDPYAHEAQYDREDDLEATKRDAAAVLALEQLFRIGIPFVVPIDQHDVITYADTATNTIYVIESYPGGSGIVARIFDSWPSVLRKGVEIAESCACKDPLGCPYCIVPPRRHDPMDKAAGMAIARRMLELV